MTIEWATFSLPKAGHRASENEDAAAVGTERAAVCDGASEGWGSGAWARHLAVALAAEDVQPGTFTPWLARARAAAPTAKPATSWYAEEKQAVGAFSTFLAIRFEGGRYRACACGDSLLVHLRGERTLAKFPLERAEQFNNRPALVGNSPESGEPEVEWFAGRAEPGDAFYLMTDALAEWFLRGLEAGLAPARGVEDAAASPAAFAEWIECLRSAKAMKNDDVTLIRARIGVPS